MTRFTWILFACLATIMATSDRREANPGEVEIANTDGEYQSTDEAAPETISILDDSSGTAPSKVAPKIVVSEVNIRTIAGQPISINVTFEGGPATLIKWMKDNVDLRNEEGVKITSDVNRSSLLIQSSNRKDNGTFHVTIMNEHGYDTAQWTAHVFSVPSIPEGHLMIHKEEGEPYNLTWLPPLDDGGTAVLYYKVEKWDTLRDSWQTVCKFTNTSAKIDEQMSGLVPKFRVTAVNLMGESEPLRGLTNGVPRKPMKPELREIEKNTIRMSWKKSTTISSRPLTYIVQKRKLGTLIWFIEGSTTRNHYTVTDLEYDVQYEIRLRANSTHGISEPSDSNIVLIPSNSLLHLFSSHLSKGMNREKKICDISFPTVKTFDGVKYNAPLPSCYTVVTMDCSSSEFPDFAILMKASIGGTTRSMKILTRDSVIKLEVGNTTDSLTVEIGGELVKIVDKLMEANVFMEKGTLVVQESSFMVEFNWNLAKIHLSTSYHARTCGLCGDFDNSEEEEFKLPNGNATSNIGLFVKAYEHSFEECVTEDIDDAEYFIETTIDNVERNYTSFYSKASTNDSSNSTNFCEYLRGIFVPSDFSSSLLSLSPEEEQAFDEELNSARLGFIKANSSEEFMNWMESKMPRSYSAIVARLPQLNQNLAKLDDKSKYFIHLIYNHSLDLILAYNESNIEELAKKALQKSEAAYFELPEPSREAMERGLHRLPETTYSKHLRFQRNWEHLRNVLRESKAVTRYYENADIVYGLNKVNETSTIHRKRRDAQSIFETAKEIGIPAYEFGMKVGEYVRYLRSIEKVTMAAYSEFTIDVEIALLHVIVDSLSIDLCECDKSKKEDIQRAAMFAQMLLQDALYCKENPGRRTLLSLFTVGGKFVGRVLFELSFKILGGILGDIIGGPFGGAAGIEAAGWIGRNIGEHVGGDLADSLECDFDHCTTEASSSVFDYHDWHAFDYDFHYYNKYMKFEREIGARLGLIGYSHGNTTVEGMKVGFNVGVINNATDIAAEYKPLWVEKTTEKGRMGFGYNLNTGYMSSINRTELSILGIGYMKAERSFGIRTPFVSCEWNY